MDELGGQESPLDGWKMLNLRYPGTCEVCGDALAAGTIAWHNRARHKIRCQSCKEAVSPVAPESANVGTAGRSANRHYEQLVKSHQGQVRAEIEEDLAWRQQIKIDHPVLGRFVSALTAKPTEGPPPQKVTAWKKGAEGEQEVGQLLDQWAARGIGRVLHDRRIPRTKANIDHLAVNSEGVWVIDTKNYTGLVKVSLGVLNPQQLTVNGKDHTDLASRVRWQMDHVAQALDSADPNSRPPVRGVLCFARAEWPLLEGTSTIKGVTVAWPKATIKLLTPKKQLPEVEDPERWMAILARAFPSA